MWPETAKMIRFELSQLRRLVASFEPLLSKVCTTEPDYIELSSLAAFLHSFYGGIENIFKRIAMEIDETLPSGDRWHAGLIALMTERTSKRGAVISKSLYNELIKYMGFRHMFRHAYTYDLKWRKMDDLVLCHEGVLNRLEEELLAFLQSAEG